MRRRRLRRDRREAYSVDVTAFLSLLVILVPFLLVTAVFSRVAILELQPAALDTQASVDVEGLGLQVTLREQAIEVQHQGLQRPLRIHRDLQGGAIDELAELAARLKRQYPAEEEVTVLLEPQVPYGLLVMVLDALRIGAPLSAGESGLPLFPNIALGNAPAGGGAG